MGQTANSTMVERFRARRRIYAILVASGFLVGAVGDARPCPHHDLLPESVSARFSAHGEPGNEAEHGLAHAADQRDATPDVHECLCVDICEVDVASEAKSSAVENPAPIGVFGARPALAKQVHRPRPTAVLVPLPNAPPGLA